MVMEVIAAIEERDTVSQSGINGIYSQKCELFVRSRSTLSQISQTEVRARLRLKFVT